MAQLPDYPAVEVNRIENDLNQEFKALEGAYYARKARRLDAWKRYQFQPYGNEKANASSIVDSTIYNAVEWMLPSLIQPFMETSDFIKVVPESGNLKDIMAAEYNRELLTYQMRKRMDLYQWYYDIFKTFLVAGDGYAKLTWQERDLRSGEPVGRPALSFVNPNAVRWDWTVQGGFMHSRVVTHEEDWSRSDVLGIYKQEGVIKENLDAALKGMGRSWKTTYLRDEAVESKGYEGENLDILESAKKLFLRREQWTEYDLNDDGILVPVMAVFIDDHLVQVIENPYDFKRPPFVSAEMVRDPMGNPALGLADILGDLQKFKTAMLRMTSDNLNAQLNGLFEVDTMNVDDIGLQLLMNAPQGSRIGIPVRKPGSITPLQANPIAPQIFQIWEQVQIEGENRGGHTRYSQGLDSKSLNQTATGFVGITQRSEMRMWEVATRFAESTLKPLIRMMISLNQQKLEPQDIEVQFGIDGRDFRIQDASGQEVELSIDPGELIKVSPEDISGYFSVTLDLDVGSDKQQKINNLFQYGQYLGSLPTVDPEVLNKVNQMILVETARLMGLPKVEAVVKKENYGRGISAPGFTNSPAGPTPGASGGLPGSQGEPGIQEALPGPLPGQPLQ